MLSMFNVLGKLKGGTRIDTIENYSIAGIIFGAFLLATGIGLTILDPAGISAMLSMSGALIAFCFTVVLVFVWVAKEILKKE